MNKYAVGQTVKLHLKRGDVSGEIYAVYNHAVWLVDAEGNHWHFDPHRDFHVTIESEGGDE